MKRPTSPLGVIVALAVVLGVFIPDPVSWSVAASGHAMGVPVELQGSDSTEASVYPYLIRPSGQRGDPINLFFLGSSDVQSVANLITSVYGWSEEGGGTMFFAQGNDVTPQDIQLSSPTVGGRRYHVRLKAGQGTLGGQPCVIGAIHTDHTTACGHVGRDFSDDRELVSRYLAQAGLGASKANWGNTAGTRHCTGEENSGDGTVSVIQLPAVESPSEP